MPYLTKSPQIYGQNKSEACKPEELVKITSNGFFENGDFCYGGKFKLVKKFELCYYKKKLLQSCAISRNFYFNNNNNKL